MNKHPFEIIANSRPGESFEIRLEPGKEIYDVVEQPYHISEAILK